MTRSASIAVLCCVASLGVFASPAAAQKAKGKRYALLVGVNEYDNERLKPLKYAENDVDVLATLLTKSGFDEVVVLTNTRGKKDKALTPTAPNVRKRIEWLTADREKDDLILFAYAGLGTRLSVEDPDGRRKARIFSYLFPRDAQLNGVSYSTGRSRTLIHVEELIADVGESKAGAKLMLLDASREESRGKESGEKQKLTVPANTAVLFSCADGQRSSESDKLKHGVFFHHVIGGLSGKARNRNDEVRWANLAEYVAERVSEDTPILLGGGAKQTPTKLERLAGPSPVLVPAKK